MDLGTGKDLEEYEINGKKIPFHLIDIVEPGTKYNLFEYQRDFLEAYNDIRSRGKKSWCVEVPDFILRAFCAAIA